MALGRDAAARLLKQIRGQRILVVGDMMLDEFLWGSVSRISPEAPVPVVKVTRQSFHLGGAGNVACNVRALGGEAVVVGVVGRDPAGERVVRDNVVGNVAASANDLHTRQPSERRAQRCV